MQIMMRAPQQIPISIQRHDAVIIFSRVLPPFPIRRFLVACVDYSLRMQACASFASHTRDFAG